MCCWSGTFREDNFQKAIGALTEAAAEAKGRPGAKSGKGGRRGGSNMAPDEKPDIYKIVRMCMERNYDPLIVFSFSKKECENLAKQVWVSVLPYLSPFLVSCHVPFIFFFFVYSEVTQESPASHSALLPPETVSLTGHSSNTVVTNLPLRSVFPVLWWTPLICISGAKPA